MELSDQLKMAAQMGMKGGMTMAIKLLEGVANDPRSRETVTIKMALEVAIKCLQEEADRQRPEGRA